MNLMNLMNFTTKFARILSMKELLEKEKEELKEIAPEVKMKLEDVMRFIDRFENSHLIPLHNALYHITNKFSKHNGLEDNPIPDFLEHLKSIQSVSDFKKFWGNDENLLSCELQYFNEEGWLDWDERKEIQMELNRIFEIVKHSDIQIHPNSTFRTYMKGEWAVELL